MYTAALSLLAGHLFTSIDGNDWILDTGAPTTFGDVKKLIIESKEFVVPSDYMGLNAAQLSEFVGHSVTGIIGADVLNYFDVLIDIKSNKVSLATDEIPLTGDTLEIEEFMGVPIVLASIVGSEKRMFFDTGAKISYSQDESISNFPSAGTVSDFYPGIGEFQTETYMVDVVIGSKQHTLRCGSLPDLLGMTLMMAGTEGIIGNEVMKNKVVGYFPKRNRLVFA